KELGLVRGHVYTHWTVALASLAAEAEVERLLHRPAPPTAIQHFTIQHLPEEPRPSSGGVHLFPGGHVAGAHGPAGLPAAGSHPNAAEHRAREGCPIGGITEVGPRRRRVVIGADAQVVSDRIRVHHLARIHPVLGIPDRLELPEGL